MALICHYVSFVLIWFGSLVKILSLIWSSSTKILRTRVKILMRDSHSLLLLAAMLKPPFEQQPSYSIRGCLHHNTKTPYPLSPMFQVRGSTSMYRWTISKGEIPNSYAGELSSSITGVNLSPTGSKAWFPSVDSARFEIGGARPVLQPMQWWHPRRSHFFEQLINLEPL
jgi:hypothetical protein